MNFSLVLSVVSVLSLITFKSMAETVLNSCGTIGFIEDRIKDCSEKNSQSNQKGQEGVFKLVMVDSQGQFWQDQKSKKVWGPFKNSYVNDEKFGNEGVRKNTNISIDHKFLESRLCPAPYMVPTSDDVMKALTQAKDVNTNGFNELLQGLVNKGVQGLWIINPKIEKQAKITNFQPALFNLQDRKIVNAISELNKAKGSVVCVSKNMNEMVLVNSTKNVGFFINVEESRNRLRIAKRSINETLSWYLLGFNQPKEETGIDATQLNFTSLFKDEEINHMDPEFLIEVNNGVPGKVYAFEFRKGMGDSRYIFSTSDGQVVDHSNDVNSKREFINKEYIKLPQSVEASLPIELLDVPYSTNDAKKASIKKVATFIGSMLPYMSAVTVPLDMLINYVERKRTYQAMVLLVAIEDILYNAQTQKNIQSYIGGGSSAISNEIAVLKQIDDALRVRFGIPIGVRNLFHAVFGGKKEQSENADRAKRIEEDNAKHNSMILDDLISALGTSVFKITSSQLGYFDSVFINPANLSKIKSLEDAINPIINKNDVDKIAINGDLSDKQIIFTKKYLINFIKTYYGYAEKNPNFKFTDSDWVLVGTFSKQHSSMPVVVTNLSSDSLKSDQVLVTSAIQHGIDLMTFTPVPFLSTILNLGYFVGKTIAAKKGNDYFSTSYAQLSKMLAEIKMGGGVGLPDEGSVSVEVLLASLKESGIDEGSISTIKELIEAEGVDSESCVIEQALNCSQKNKLNNQLKKQFITVSYRKAWDYTLRAWKGITALVKNRKGEMDDYISSTLKTFNEVEKKRANEDNKKSEINKSKVQQKQKRELAPSDDNVQDGTFSYIKVMRSNIERLPSSLKPSTSNIKTDHVQPVIIFLVDGMRPDTFRQAADSGWVPHLNDLFLKSGVEVKSFSSRAVSIPSWATIETGTEIDLHGIRSNTITTRNGQIENFLDARFDYVLPWFVLDSRSSQMLSPSGVKRFSEIMYAQLGEKKSDQKKMFIGLSTINKGVLPDVPEMTQQIFSKKNFSNIMMNGINGSKLLDQATGAATVEEIKRNKNLKVIKVWFASIDSNSHYHGNEIEIAYRTVDKAIGDIMSEAKKHPLLKNASMFLISDHGHSGGCFLDREPRCWMPSQMSYQLLPKSNMAKISKAEEVSGPHPTQVNSRFNIIRYFTGNTPSSPLCLDVKSAIPMLPNYDLKYMTEYQLHLPDQKTPANSNRKKHTSQLPTVSIDFESDALAQVYLSNKEEQELRRNYYQLTHLPSSCSDSKEQLTNLFDSFFQVETNLLSDQVKKDPYFTNNNIKTSGYKPVKYVAMAIPKYNSDRFITNKIIGEPLSQDFREPVLVKSIDKMAMIFTKRFNSGSRRAIDKYQYVVLKIFDQEADGTIKVSVAGDDNEKRRLDPFGYHSLQGLSSDQLSGWKTDRELLTLLTKQSVSDYPTAIFTLAQTLTLNPDYGKSLQETYKGTINLQKLESLVKKRLAEIPDFLLIASHGVGLSPSSIESDHGNLTFSEVRNSFFVGQLSEGKSSQLKLKNHDQVPPMLTRDVLPTLLDFAGVAPSDDFWRSEWKSFKTEIDGIKIQ